MKFKPSLLGIPNIIAAFAMVLGGLQPPLSASNHCHGLIFPAQTIKWQ